MIFSGYWKGAGLWKFIRMLSDNVRDLAQKLLHLALQLGEEKGYGISRFTS